MHTAAFYGSGMGVCVEVSASHSCPGILGKEEGEGAGVPSPWTQLLAPSWGLCGKGGA